jgi:cob(I)alamin adenosyltransferase
VSIVTAAGDTGTTGLLGGERVPKDQARIECLGALDELNAFLGDARCALGEDNFTETAGLDPGKLIRTVQEELFTVSAAVASRGGALPGGPDGGRGKTPEPDEPRLSAWVRDLEAVFPIRGFSLAGANPVSAKLDIARTVCRRAERRMVTLHRLEGVPPVLLAYMNRLSDLLFMLARAREGRT